VGRVRRATHDGIALEALGRPTAVVVTAEFLHEANLQRDALGMPDLAAVVIDHPLSTLSDAEIALRAEQAAAQAVAVWLGKERA
jgi:hypothetical protein